MLFSLDITLLIICACVDQHADNDIDGEVFCELTEEEVKELVKPLGVVKKIVRLQKSVAHPVTSVR